MQAPGQPEEGSSGTPPLRRAGYVGHWTAPVPAVHAAEQPCREAWDRPPRRGARQGLSWELSAIAGPGSSLVDERPPWCRRKTSWAAVASPRTEPRAPFPPGGQPSLWFCSKTLTRVQGAARCKSQLTPAS